MPVSPAFWLTKFKLRGALQIKSMTYEAQCRRCWEPSGIVCAQTGASHPSLRVERFSLPRNQPLFPQKGHFDRAIALTVRLLWMLWIAVEKARKASHRFTVIVKAVPLCSSSWDSPPGTGS
jgi:hypothetical protein